MFFILKLNVKPVGQLRTQGRIKLSVNSNVSAFTFHVYPKFGTDLVLISFSLRLKYIIYYITYII